jgi:hypothetical protein
MGFWKKGKGRHDHEAGGSGRRSPPRRARTTSPQRQRDRRYIPVTHCQALYQCGQSIDWPDCSLPGGWHLNSVGPDRVAEIRRRRALMPARLRADPAFGYDSQWWDNFGPRERDPVRRAAFLGVVAPNPYVGVYMPERGLEPP